MEKRPVKYFLFDIRWYDAMEGLFDYQKTDLLDAICHYAKYGEMPDFKDVSLRAILRLICNDIDDQGNLADEMVAQFEESDND